MKLLILLASILVPLPFADADDFYVDAVQGSDTTGNGSSDKPWRTITFALSQSTNEDDVVHVRPGTYDPHHGEAFPLRPSSGVDLVSTQGAEQTFLVGDGSSPVILIDSTVDFAESHVTGFTVAGGSDGIALHSQVRNYTVFLTNNTISGNLRAGVYTGTRLESENGRLFYNEISGNRLGFYNSGRSGGAVWGIVGNRILGNLEDGVRIAGPFAGGTFNAERNLIANNGGIGWTQRIPPDIITSIQSTLTNTTISGNAGGGLYTFANYACYYLPYFGYRCVDPTATIAAVNSTIGDNGGFGGTMRAGTSATCFGSMFRSIAWGNSPIDNNNFRPYFSDIGTGVNTGSGVISVDPRFVSLAKQDLRLRFDSPCVDAVNTGTGARDVEGEPRNEDGNSDGVLLDDFGSDEFHTLVFPGTPPMAGQPFWFEAQAPPAEDGNLVTVVLSLDDGSDSGGILVPGSGGRRLDLEADALFSFGLSILPFLQTTLQSQVGLTPACNLPAGGFGAPIHYAAVTLDVAGGQFVSITPTHAFVIQ